MFFRLSALQDILSMAHISKLKCPSDEAEGTFYTLWHVFMTVILYTKDTLVRMKTKLILKIAFYTHLYEGSHDHTI